MANWFLQFWIKDYEDKTDVLLFVGMNLFILIASNFARIARSVSLMVGSTDVTRIVNFEMLFALAHASLNKFFDKVPIGRILNRFAKDTQTIDVNLYIQVDKASILLFGLVLDLVVSIVIAGPLMIPLVIVYVYAGFSLQQYNMNLLREGIRLQSITVSPITQAFTEAIYGGKTIRALGCEKYILEDYQYLINENLKNFLILNAGKQWFNQRVQFLSFIIVVPSILLSVLFALIPRSSSCECLPATSRFFSST